MTVTRYACPDAGLVGSTRWTLTTNGVATDVWGMARTTEYTVPDFWTIGDSPEVSFVTIAANEAVTFALTCEDAITSVAFFPRETVTSYTIAGSTVTFTLQVGQFVRVEANPATASGTVYGRAEPCYCRVLDLLSTPSGTTYNGTQTKAATGATLVFPAGQVVDLVNAGAWQDKLFEVEAGANVFIPGDTVVRGSFDLRALADIRVYGHGVLLGDWIDNEDLPGPFAVNFEHTLLYGHDPGIAPDNVSVEGITLLRAPFYSTSGQNNYDEVMVLSPWTDNTDGIKPIGQLDGDDTYTVTNCVVWVGDDAVTVEQWRGNGTVTGNLLSTSGSACFIHAYQLESWESGLNYSLTLRDNVVRAVADYYVEEDGDEGGAVMQCWTDGYRGISSLWTRGVTHIGCKVQTDDGGRINCAPMLVGNKEYPWGDPRDQCGQVTDWILDGFEFDKVPTALGQFVGYDKDNAPNGFTIRNWRMGGVKLSARNFGDYFTVSDYCWNITVDGASIT